MIRDGRLAAKLALGLFSLTLFGCIGISFSPDGTKLAFPWGQDGKLTVLDLKTRSLRKVARSEAALLPAWSPKGDLIAAFGGPKSESLLLVDTVKGAETKLADKCGGAVWSEDGNKLAYIVNQEDGSLQCVWYEVASRKRAGSIQLPKDLKPEPFLTWLPKTEGVAFVGHSGNRADVYIADFGEVRKVTTTGDVVGLAASQDGAYLEWARKSRNPKYILLSLYRYDLNLRSVQRMPFPERIPEINPAPRTGPDGVEWVFFSPDLSRLILSLRYEGPQPKGDSSKFLLSGGGASALFVVGSDGSGAKQIAKWSTAGASKVYYWPAFSWDSKQIALLHTGGKTDDVLLMNADGTNRRVILSQPASK